MAHLKYAKFEGPSLEARSIGIIIIGIVSVTLYQDSQLKTNTYDIVLVCPGIHRGA